MIDLWKEVMVENAAAWIGWGGLIIGIIFGFIVQRTNFCTMGSISDILSFGDWRRFRAWLMATGVAIIGVAVLERTAIADMSFSMYVTPNLTWGGHIIGGFIFGIGMVFGGGCVSKNLVRAGGGDLRSLIVLVVIGISAYMTIGGLFGPTRVALVEPMTADLTAAGFDDQRIGTILSGVTGMASGTANLIAVILFGGGFVAYGLANKAFRSSPSHMIAGIGIGLCVIAGWLLTAMTFDEFADNPTLASLSYVRPAGDSIDYFMRFTAFDGISFSVVTTLGALIGAFIGAVTQKRFHLATFSDAPDTLRNLGGGVLMGIGGVVALGCTVGQAVTGFSTLAVGSLLTFIFIIIGGIVGMKAMEAMA
ncbi:YeeE/YedE family protein [Aliiroseovarius subalbicans]|uniref:YeeE/YedE family protein n=1 Tax=Aliiroseovarius subalbicans TaxID=2925840 RepID=UPI001F595A92|nr:YeeE/YedE family protein [Aliiroseovarius subalbicans]MCI2400122.1 YeeE/YedE family protein [Aliiroseovarius subalbicans]